MKRENNKVLITLLIIIIVILSVLCILFATGTINFKTNGDDKAPTNDVSNKFKLVNNGVTESDLDEVFNILGLYEYYHSELYSSFDAYNECLNNYLSQDNYKNNSKEIFAFYSLIHNMDTDTGQNAIIRDVDGDGKADIAACGGAADCGSIKISDANKIINLYKLVEMDEYLSEMPEPYKDSEYLINYYSLTGMHPIMCNIQIKHDIVTEYGHEQDLVVIDKQNVLEYGFFEESEQVKTKVDRTVTYKFKKDNNQYYLDTVSVK